MAAGTPKGGQFAAAPRTEASLEPLTAEPTPDQSYCDIDRHQQCSGYTEDEFDPESCFCGCHNERLEDMR